MKKTCIVPLAHTHSKKVLVKKLSCEIKSKKVQVAISCEDEGVNGKATLLMHH